MEASREASGEWLKERNAETGKWRLQENWMSQHSIGRSLKMGAWAVLLCERRRGG